MSLIIEVSNASHVKTRDTYVEKARESSSVMMVESFILVDVVIVSGV